MPRIKHVHDYRLRTFRIGWLEGIDGRYCTGCGARHPHERIAFLFRRWRNNPFVNAEAAVALFRPGPHSPWSGTRYPAGHGRHPSAWEKRCEPPNPDGPAGT